MSQWNSRLKSWVKLGCRNLEVLPIPKVSDGVSGPSRQKQLVRSVTNLVLVASQVQLRRLSHHLVLLRPGLVQRQVLRQVRVEPVVDAAGQEIVEGFVNQLRVWKLVQNFKLKPVTTKFFWIRTVRFEASWVSQLSSGCLRRKMNGDKSRSSQIFFLFSCPWRWGLNWEPA